VAVVIAAAVDAWRRAFPHAPRHVTRTVRVATREQLPPRLHPRRLYLIGDPAKWALLHCPCGYNHDIDLNLLNPARPRWTVTTGTSGRPALHPSVDVRAGRRCHFWLRDGTVDWCADHRVRRPFGRPS
jgi:hypothetical protein